MKTKFSDEQFERAYPDGIEYHWWHLARGRIVASAINAFEGPESSVLEIGCGRGIVVKSLRDAGIDCSGVELAEVQAIYNVEKHIRTGIDAVDLSDTERELYGTLLLLDVIEHIPEPAPFLQNLADAFPNVSRIIITVPARQELWSNYDKFYGHYRRYTTEMLETLSSELCWSLRRKSYFFHLVYLPAWIMAKLKGNRETRLKPPQESNRWIHRLISYAMIVDYYLFQRRLAGTSLIGCFHLGENAAQKNTAPDRLSATLKGGR